MIDTANTPNTSKINHALERTWARIRDLHPDVPAAVIVLGLAAYTERGSYVGHFAPARWSTDAARLPEVLIAGELLTDLPQVLETLLHEAAHGLAHTRKIKDTSREGRYHNKKFAALAAEIGLEAKPDEKIGFRTALAKGTLERFADELAALDAAHHATGRAHRLRPAEKRRNETGRDEDQHDDSDNDQDDEDEEDEEDNEPQKRKREITITCSCERKIRIALRGLDAGEVFCGRCGTAFEPAE